MTTTHYGSDMIGSGVQITLAGSSGYFIDTDVTVLSTNDDAIRGYGIDESTITVAGRVVGTATAVELRDQDSQGSADDSDSNVIHILSGGSVVGDWGIDVNGNSNSVTNAGEVSGDVAVLLDGNNNSLANAGRVAGMRNSAISVHGDANSIHNSGTISLSAPNSDASVSSAIGLTGVENNLTNTGLIEATGASNIALTIINPVGPSVSYTCALTNLGTITSDGVALKGSIRSEFVTNAGTIVGNILFGGGADADRLENSGVIVGDVYDFGPASVENSGRISGTLTTSDHVDTVRNSGTIGELDLGGKGDVYRGAGGQVTGTIFAGAGKDTIKGGAETDIVDGGAGRDSIFGRGGDDDLSGGAGDDDIRGGAGDDTIRGGKGDDDIRGGRGDDTLTGDAGADRFLFNGHSGHDTITDFTVGEDRIVLAHAGIAAFSELAPQISSSGSDAVIDLRGSGLNLDVVIVVEGAAGSLSATDFLFT